MAEPVEPAAYEQVTRAYLDSVEARTAKLEERFQASQEALNGNLARLWTAVTSQKEEIVATFQEHAKADTQAFSALREQMWTRLPTWATLLLTASGGAIGALAMWIIDKLGR